MMLSRILKVSLIVFLFCAVQFQESKANVSFGFFEDSSNFLAASNVIVSYFDIANGNTFVQVTNIDSTQAATIHVQIFADLNNCVDRDFTDTLTPNETHVYDISNLQSANGNPINFALPANSHGFVLISAGNGMGAPLDSLIGNFRVVRNAGYEYRVNSASCTGVPAQEVLVARFTNDWGANQSDVVGVRIVQDPSAMNPLADGTEDLSVQITDPYELFMFDNEETGTSCGDVPFGCDERPGDDDNPNDDDDLDAFTADFINQGINDIFPNTRGGLPLCAGDLNTDGFIRLTSPNADLFRDIIGFIGLNDGANRGSMDRFKTSDELLTPG